MWGRLAVRVAIGDANGLQDDRNYYRIFVSWLLL